MGVPVFFRIVYGRVEYTHKLKAVKTIKAIEINPAGENLPNKSPWMCEKNVRF